MLGPDLKAALMAEGASHVGYADVRPLPSPLRYDMPVGVSIVVALDPVAVAGVRHGPGKRYQAERARADALLARLTARAADGLKACGHLAAELPVPPSDVDTFIGSRLLPHKTVAAAAGLGWIGKCDALVTREFGSAVRLRTLLTDAPLPPAAPLLESSCGECRACADACPVAAPSGRNWRFLLPRCEFFDADACRRGTRQVARRHGLSDLVCGMCIGACPYTTMYLARACE